LDRRLAHLKASNYTGQHTGAEFILSIPLLRQSKIVATCRTQHSMFTVIHRKYLEGLTVEPFLVYGFIFAFAKGSTSGSVLASCMCPSAVRINHGHEYLRQHAYILADYCEINSFDTFISRCTVVMVCKLVNWEGSVFKVLYLTLLK
jgi:hypothetical protein